MQKTAVTLVLVVLLLVGCTVRPTPRKSGWRCTLPPDGFQAADLVGTWELRSHRGDRLILREDGTCWQVYENRAANRYFTAECTWYLAEGWGGFYLHVRGMHRCVSIGSLCENPGGGGGDWLYYDFCSDKVLKMPNEVVLAVNGVSEDFERVYGQSAPRGIILRHMQDEPDTVVEILILRE